jgi:xylulose-5-phosphate/fructose-6-phosphate phosphoketolase
MAPEQKVGTESLSPFGPARTTVDEKPLSEEELDLFTRYFHATLYLCLGMIYLKENPLLREPLKVEQLKRRLLGHWGSDAGQSFTYLHFNRLIKKYDLDAIFVAGPGKMPPNYIPCLPQRLSKSLLMSSFNFRSWSASSAIEFIP